MVKWLNYLFSGGVWEKTEKRVREEEEWGKRESSYEGVQVSGEWRIRRAQNKKLKILTGKEGGP